MADQVITLVNKLIPITVNESALKDFTHYSDIKFSDINDASFTTQGDTVSVQLGSTGDNYVVSKALLDVVEAFATTGTLTAQAGTVTDPDNFITASDVLVAGPKIAAAGAVPATLAGSSGASSEELQVRFTTQGGTGAPADITAGKVRVYLNLYSR